MVAVFVEGHDARHYERIPKSFREKHNRSARDAFQDTKRWPVLARDRQGVGDDQVGSILSISRSASDMIEIHAITGITTITAEYDRHVNASVTSHVSRKIQSMTGFPLETGIERPGRGDTLPSVTVNSPLRVSARISLPFTGTGSGMER
jgi:hypothetical protein